MKKESRRITKEEFEIIQRINKSNIEIYAEKREYWRIYREVIKATKIQLKDKSKIKEKI